MVDEQCALHKLATIEAGENTLAPKIETLALKARKFLSGARPSLTRERISALIEELEQLKEAVIHRRRFPKEWSTYQCVERHPPT